MSEYQCYEFLAIDAPLSSKQQQELRDISTRAETLWPPWKRTTTSARSLSQSTILPLPSSPHWAPITATLAIVLSLHTRKRLPGADAGEA